jgi:hypothetical protein
LGKKPLKRSGFPIIDFSGGAELALGRAKSTGFQRKSTEKL